jgi:methylated-DNA-protein-cysteine methyltransferase-like protein
MARRSADKAAATDKTSFYAEVWAWVRHVPRGRVVTYGQVATALGSPRAARAVGYAMFFAGDAPGRGPIPWHRVVNAQGEISLGGATSRPAQQRALLEAEGVAFDAEGRLCLKTYRYTPRLAARQRVDMRFV